MNESRLMIVMGNKEWTRAALHLACAVARSGEANVLLLKMVPVRHPLMLGTETGYLDFTPEDMGALEDMSATAEDYGVSLDVHVFQYANYWSGLVDAAAQLEATAVITQIPPSPIPYWHDFRCWLLRHRLARQGQLLLPMDDMTPSLVWTPSLTLQNDMTHLLNQRQS
jgi:hypothetical protein